jgi:hypothetical protein
MGLFEKLFKTGDPVGGALLSDALGMSGKKNKWSLGKKAQRKIDLYNAFIRGGVDLQEELQPRLLALERAAAEDSAGAMADIYRRIVGPASEDLAASANRAQRQADLADLEQFGGDYTRARLAAEDADPRNVQRKAYEDQLLREAMAQFGLGADMDPRELRRVQQLARMNRSSAGFGQGSENDLLQEALALVTHGEDLRTLRTNRALAALGGTRAETTDPLMVVLGRPAVSLPFAQGAYSQGASRLGPYNAVEPTYGSDLLNAHYADLFSRRNKASADKAAEYQLYSAAIGSLGNIAGAAGGAMICWVAREVFGADNRQWLQFRTWLLTMAPPWFVQLYTLIGPQVADYLREHPQHKPDVRHWMEERIAEMKNPQPEQNYAV